ncbi:MAG: WYL domain-containing protein [Oscillospiraceae bacterium]|nr:WYL domain-containing protein [Oscillospiraceae bacterium]
MTKNRLLLTLQYLWNETDADHKVSGVGLMKYLASRGLKPPTRNTIYKDIAELQEFGVRIEKYKGTQNWYWIDERVFSGAELQLLVDAVQAATFISRKKSTQLIEKLAVFAGRDEDEVLNRKLHTAIRPKSSNDDLLYIVNEIQYAINKKRKITFLYADYNERKKKVYRHDSQIYVVSPYSMLWNDDNYYMIGWSDSHDKVVCFRVNRIEKVSVIGDRAVRKPKGYREQDYYSQIFSMYDGLECEVKLLCTNDMMNIIVDRFGLSVKTDIMDSEHFRVTATVRLSTTFYGWICSLGGKVKLLSPQEAVDGLHELIAKID